jgi:hypothetical protein
MDFLFILSYIDRMRKGSTLPDSLEERLKSRIARMRGDVFSRADFDDLGGYDQVGRALRTLVRKGLLMKIGQGLYARASESPLSEPPVPPKGLATLTEALQRLGVEPMPSRLRRAYNAGETTQVPTGRVVAVRGRVRRQIGYNGVYLKFERTGPSAR